MNNYQEPEAARTGHEEDDIENFNGETEGLNLRSTKLILLLYLLIKGENASLWDEKSDMLLIQNYYDYKDLPDCEVQLCILFTKMNLPQFSTQDIKKRIKKLKLEKGREKAQEMFDMIYLEVIKVRKLYLH